MLGAMFQRVHKLQTFLNSFSFIILLLAKWTTYTEERFCLCDLVAFHHCCKFLFLFYQKKKAEQKGFFLHISTFQVEDTEAVCSHTSGIQQTALALRESDERQGAPGGSLWELHAVPLLRQLLVKQRAEQLWRNVVYDIRQQAAVLVERPGAIRQGTSAGKDEDNIHSDKAKTEPGVLLSLWWLDAWR